MPDRPPTVPPPKRTYKQRRYRGSATDTQDLYAAVGSAVVGFGVGGLLAARLGRSIIVGALAGAIIAYAVTKVVLWLSVKLIAGPLQPSGSSTGYKTDYSLPRSLLAQGKFAEAAEAFEIAALESDGDPDPYFELARLYRDHFRQYEDALAWFRRAQTDARLSSGQELLATQEIVDLYTMKLGTPRKALPELIKLTERFPGTPAAEGAAKELASMREMLAREREGEEPFTAQYLKDRQR